jgi:hypothetical protein
MVAASSPAQVRKPLDGMARFWVEANPPYYAELARRHRAGIAPITGPITGPVTSPGAAPLTGP